MLLTPADKKRSIKNIKALKHEDNLPTHLTYSSQRTLAMPPTIFDCQSICNTYSVDTYKSTSKLVQLLNTLIKLCSVFKASIIKVPFIHMSFWS